MSQQSDMADRFYDQLAKSDVSVADLVEELRLKWGPEHRVPEVHCFVEEVAASLLREDVEIGDILDGRFSAWMLERWDAHAKVAQELLAMDTFLDDKNRYVFYRTQKHLTNRRNQRPQCEVSPVCLPRCRAAAYLFLVRPKRSEHIWRTEHLSRQRNGFFG
jgi:hypothetical protein